MVLPGFCRSCKEESNTLVGGVCKVCRCQRIKEHREVSDKEIVRRIDEYLKRTAIEGYYDGKRDWSFKPRKCERQGCQQYVSPDALVADPKARFCDGHRRRSAAERLAEGTV